MQGLAEAESIAVSAKAKKKHGQAEPYISVRSNGAVISTAQHAERSLYVRSQMKNTRCSWYDMIRIYLQRSKYQVLVVLVYCCGDHSYSSQQYSFSLL